MLNLVNVMKCPTKSKHKPPICNLGVSICVWVIFRLGLGSMFIRIRVTSLLGALLFIFVTTVVVMVQLT